MSWASGRLLREYTFLLDPPEAQAKLPQVAAPVTLPATPAVAAAAPMPPTPPPPPAAPASPVAVAPSAAAAPIAPIAPIAPVEAPAKAQAKPRPAEVKPVPERAAAAPATRLVKEGDTLGKIAVQSKPEGVSLDQMLLALFRSNEDAFDAANMNRLKAGKILKMPEASVAQAIDATEAKKTIVAQSADFNAYRKKLAATAAGGVAKEAAAGQAASGKILPKVEDKVPAPVAGKDKLEVSKSAAAKDSKAAADGKGAKRLAALEEDVVARDKALQEAKSRIAALEKNINDLKKLVELKSQSMAQLQQQAQVAANAKVEAPKPAAKPEAAKAEATKLEAPKVEAPKPEAAKHEAAKPEAAPAEAPKPESVAPAPAKAPPPAPAAAAKPPVKPAPQPPPSFIESNPQVVIGGAGILVLLLAYAAYAIRRRRARAAEGDRGALSRIGDTGLATGSVIGTSGGQSVDTTNSSLHTDFSQSGMAALDSEEGVDPVAEADVYMAYGRDTQAEEILLEALKTDPTRHAIRLKLLEIYAARKSLKQFEAVATDLYSQTGGVGPDWEKAAVLVEKIDPENPLYGHRAAELGEPAAAPADLGQFGLSEEPERAAAAAEPAAPEAAAEEVPMSLDFDLDLGAAEAPAEPAAAATEPEPEPQAEPEPESQPQAEEAASLDFDMELPSLDAGAVAAEPVAEPSMEAEPGEAPASDLQGLDLPGIEMPEPSIEPSATLGEEGGLAFPALAEEGAAPTEPQAAATAPADQAVDFDFDLTPVQDEPAVPESAPAATAAEASAPPLDFSGIDLELEAAPVAPAEVVAPAAAPAPEALPAASEEVATKLELAHAYEEMGDKEGARELLEEVINEGNAEQQEAARVKLAQLG